jgi:hypothetical protein
LIFIVDQQIDAPTSLQRKNSERANGVEDKTFSLSHPLDKAKMEKQFAWLAALFLSFLQRNSSGDLQLLETSLSRAETLASASGFSRLIKTWNFRFISS